MSAETGFLVLSRERDQDVVIDAGGSEIVVRVIDIRGEKVRIGFKAPKDISVHRREVRDAIRGDNRRGKAAAGPAANGDSK